MHNGEQEKNNDFAGNALQFATATAGMIVTIKYNAYLIEQNQARHREELNYQLLIQRLSRRLSVLENTVQQIINNPEYLTSEQKKEIQTSILEFEAEIMNQQGPNLAYIQHWIIRTHGLLSQLDELQPIDNKALHPKNAMD